MAEYTISKIKLPNGDICNIKDTWRDIQDNLTSSSRTTESLSAKQGYLLANGSARDNTKVAKVTSTDNAIVRFNGTGGEVQNSGIIIDDNNNLTIPGSLIKFTGLGEGLDLTSDNNYFGTNSDARIISMIDSNPGTGSTAVDGGIIIQAVGRVSGVDTVQELLRIRNHNGSSDWKTGEFLWKTKDIVVETGTSKAWNISIDGNAATATAFSANKSVALTGDVTGSASSTGGWSVATTIKSSVNLTGTPTLTNTPTAGDNSKKIATTEFVMNAFTANDAMIFKGVVNANSDLPTTHYQGWTYKVATAGTYANKVCEVGDMIICVTDGTSANNDHWAVIQNNVDGAVFKGANSFTDGQVLIADGTTGKIKTSGYTIAKSVPSDAIFTDHYAWSEITSKPATATRWPAWNEISQSGANSINVGSSDVTASTEILTSYASNNGFSDTNATGVVYRRAASKIVNATLVKAALGTNTTTTNQWLNKTGAWSAPKYVDIQPNHSKTYSNVTVSANDTNNGVLFFGKVTISDTTNYGTPWYVHYRLRAEAVGTSTEAQYTKGYYDCWIGASGSNLLWHIFNNFYSGDYRPIYHHRVLYPKSGQSAQGAYLGMRIQSSRSPTTLARNYTIEIIECIGCSITLLDSLNKYSAVYNSTYYYDSELNATSTGLQEAGDANDPWFLRQYNIKAQTAITAIHMIGGTDSGYNMITNGTAFDIRYAVLYAGSAINAGSAGSNNYSAYYAANLRNSSDSYINTFTAYKNIYIKGTISGNMFTPISGGNPYVQDITAADDGYVYYYIGRAYSTDALTVDTTGGRMYWYKDGGIRPYNHYASVAITATNLAAKPSLATSGTTQITVTAGGKTSDAYTVPYATVANYPNGFASRSATASWGNTTGTCVTSWNGGDGCEMAFFKNNPASGQLSMKIDGTIYIKEGAQDISAAVKSFSVSGQTVTYTNLWGGTGTFTTQDTKNTAGSTNSTSKLFLIGATTQAANPTTNSYQYTYTNNGLLSALKLGLNLNGTEKAHLEWNNTDQSIDFIFN